MSNVKVANAEYNEKPKSGMSRKKVKAIKSLLVSTYVMVITVSYVVVGFFLNLWHPLWLIFLTIPIYASLIEAVLRKKAWIFSIEMVAVLVYVTLGIILDIWHPTWVVFLVIPVYRTTVSSFSKIKYIVEND